MIEKTTVKSILIDCFKTMLLAGISSLIFIYFWDAFNPQYSTETDKMLKAVYEQNKIESNKRDVFLKQLEDNRKLLVTNSQKDSIVASYIKKQSVYLEKIKQQYETVNRIDTFGTTSLFRYYTTQ